MTARVKRVISEVETLHYSNYGPPEVRFPNEVSFKIIKSVLKPSTNPFAYVQVWTLAL